jgi:hypothetical protein
VYLDDLLAPQWHDPSVPAPSNVDAPAIDPTRIRMIKMSAEGMDSRALNGMRRILSLGRVPYLVFVYNDGHVRGQGCAPRDLILELTDHGYKLYHAGVYITRPVDLDRFLKGMVGRSTELLFVGPGQRY